MADAVDRGGRGAGVLDDRRAVGVPDVLLEHLPGLTQQSHDVVVPVLEHEQRRLVAQAIVVRLDDELVDVVRAVDVLRPGDVRVLALPLDDLLDSPDAVSTRTVGWPHDCAIMGYIGLILMAV